jgi:TetR/AcrR family transcriptional regulator
MNKATAPKRQTKAKARLKTPAAKPRGIGRPRGGTAMVGREPLIAKTCELLARLPLKQVTRAEVARSVGAHPSLIRYYFRNRSAMLLAAFEHLTSEYLRLNDEESKGHDGSAEAKLRSRMAALCRMQVLFPFFHRLIADEIATMRTNGSRKALKHVIDRGLGSYRVILDQGVAEGSLRAMDPVFLFMVIISAAHCFVSDSYVLEQALGKKAGDKGLAQQYRTFVCDLLINGLKPR